MPRLRLCLEHARVDLGNNIIERAIRPATMGDAWVGPAHRGLARDFRIYVDRLSGGVRCNVVARRRSQT